MVWRPSNTGRGSRTIPKPSGNLSIGMPLLLDTRRCLVQNVGGHLNGHWATSVMTRIWPAGSFNLSGMSSLWPQLGRESSRDLMPWSRSGESVGGQYKTITSVVMLPTNLPRYYGCHHSRIGTLAQPSQPDLNKGLWCGQWMDGPKPNRIGRDAGWLGCMLME